MNNRKGLSSVVAISLLIIITIVATIQFSAWYKSFENNIITNIEQTQTSKNSIEVETINNNILYIKTKDNITSASIKIIDKNNNKICFAINAINKNNLIASYLFKDKLNMGKDYSENNYNGINNGVQQLSIDNNYIANFSTNVFNSGNNIKMEPTPDLSQNISISFWIKANESKTWNQRIIASTSHFASDFSAILSTDGKIRVMRGNGVDVEYSFLGNQIITDNNWHHIIITDNRNTGNIYIDGNLDSSADTSSWNVATVNKFEIGSGMNVNYLNAMIHTLNIYDRIIEENETSDYYNNFKNKTINLKKGINKINIEQCNFDKKGIYEIVIISNSQITQKNVISN